MSIICNVHSLLYERIEIVGDFFFPVVEWHLNLMTIIINLKE